MDARTRTGFLLIILLSGSVALGGATGRPLGPGGPLPQQSQPPAGQPPAPGSTARPIGTVQAIQGNTITLKTDAGAEVNVVVQDATRIVRLEPGQKTLQGATAVRLEDLQAGDRVLVGGKVSDDAKSVLASMVVLMKRSDIAQKREQEEEDWQKRGVGGLVSAIDPASGTITITTRMAGATKTVAIHTTKSTVIRRYAPGSVRFSDAQAGTLDAVKPADQLRARGMRSADGSELAAEEIVSGSFRNIAGMVSSIDAGANQITVMDLMTKQAVMVKFTADSQLRALPEMMARMIAMRLKGGAAGAPGAGPGSAAQTKAAGTPSAAATEAPGQRFGSGRGSSRAGGAPDLQQFLGRLPPETVGDLHKGDAVMIVATAGGASGAVTAINLLSGVEPILTAAPAGSQAMTLSPWSLSAPAGGDTGTP